MQIYGADLVGGINIERFDTLPPWTSQRTGIIIFVVNDDMFYFGTQLEWLVLPDFNKTQDKLRLLGSSGIHGGTGATGSRGPIGPVGATGGTGATGSTGSTGGTGKTGGTGRSGGTGGTGGTGNTGAKGGTGAMGQCKYGGSGGSGGTGTHGLIGTMLGDGDSATLLCMVEVELRGQSGNEVGIQIKNVYNSFNVDYCLVSKGHMVNNMLLSSDGTTISIYPDFFTTHNVKATMPNLTFNNSMKEVQIYTNQYFDMKLFHPLDGKYQDITGWLDYGHIIRFQVMYVAARKICETPSNINYVDFHAEALASSFDHPYVENTIGFGGAGHTFDVQFILDIPPGYTYTSVSFDFGTSNIIQLSNSSCKYTEPGSYDVTMILTGGLNGELQICKKEYINVNSSLDADFTYEFITDDPSSYPKRVKFNPVSENGGTHEWYFNRDDPSSLSTEISPINVYPDENVVYVAEHLLTIDGRTQTRSHSIFTKFNPTIDHSIELIELDVWKQIAIIRLTDTTDPDDVMLSWEWYLNEYVGTEVKYPSIQGKTVDVNYELGEHTHYQINVNFTGIARDTNTYTSTIKNIVFDVPFVERGIIAGGQYGYYDFNKDSIWVINPSNVANTSLFASLTRKCQNNCGASNGSISDGLIVNGFTYDSNSQGIYHDVVEKYKIKAFAKAAIDFARLTNKAINRTACSNLTNDKIVIAGGKTESAVNLNLVETFSISTGANHLSFGNLSERVESMCSSSNGTLNKGFFIGGFSNIAIQSIATFNFTSINSVQSFSSLATNMLNACAVSNTTNNRILIAGGQNENQNSIPINRIETFNAYVSSITTYFGNLYTTKTRVSGFSTGVDNHAFFVNGRTEIVDDLYSVNYWTQWNKDIEIVNIVSGANTSLFGELADIYDKGTAGSAGMSNSI